MVLLTLWRPSIAEEQRVKLDSSRKELNYSLSGATRDSLTVQKLGRRGWVIDSVSVQVGTGQRAFQAATACLKRWGHFQLGWTGVDPTSSTEEGALIAVTSSTLFLWTCNPLRVVYSVQKDPPPLRLPWQPRTPRRFAFAHGCLEGHMLTGEERFGVEMRPDGTVWYDILTFSKPVHPLAVAFFPLTRHFQKKFGSESAKAVTAAVAEATRT